MKLTACLSASVLTLLALPGGARGASPDTSNNPYANLDPDGVPLSVTQENSGLTSKQIDAKQQATDAERNRNWLLLDYEKEVQRRNAEAPGEDKTGNVYLELSLNKDLAQLAGLSHVETNTPTPQYRATTNPNPAAPNSMALRPATSPGSGGFTPLITPLIAPGANAAAQPYALSAYSSPLPASFTPGDSFLPAPHNSPAPKPAASADMASRLPSPTDTVDMQTPGMVASKGNDLPGPDLNLDSAGDQNGDGSLPQDANQPPQLPQIPQAMNVDQLHLNLSEKLKVPKPLAMQNAAQAQQHQTPPAAPPLPPETPMPVSQQPQVTPVRAPIGNPFDILNR